MRTDVTRMQNAYMWQQEAIKHEITSYVCQRRSANKKLQKAHDGEGRRYAPAKKCGDKIHGSLTYLQSPIITM